MATATTSPVYGPSGECGSQHNNWSCIPQNGRACCSKNGCFVKYGCQSGCVDPSDFPTVTTTVTPAPAPSSTSVLSGGKLAGVIVAAIFGVILLACAILYSRYKRPRTNRNIIFRHEEANGTTKVLELPVDYAHRNPGLVNQAAMILGAEGTTGGARNVEARGLPMPTPTPSWTRRPASSNGHYGNDPEDLRFREV
ncbi:MAG: hypothetical protein M1813_007999 [Trichoglossum hirsutum]|nr:MAG: hypothetical protein M1813_007999 [Trichoglossum hirsutum]